MRKILLEVPSCRVTLTATLRDNEEPEMAQQVWDFLENPVKVFSHPTLSTGDLSVLFPRPPLHPPKNIGDQTNPLVPDSPYLVSGPGKTEVQAGEIIWCGWNLMFVYGPSCTEPLRSGGAYVAQVDKECMDQLETVREDLWNHTYLYHKLGIINISRKES